MNSASRINTLLNALRQKTGLIHLDVKSAAQYLCDCFSGSVENEALDKYNTKTECGSVNTLKEILSEINKKTGINHKDITSALQTLHNGASSKKPIYSFGLISDIHLQYATGISDFKRALAYFKKNNIPFSCVCGDLTWAGTMVNADKYTTEWKGGLADYKDAKGDSLVYAIGGNHECYTATYDTAAKTWSSVDTGIDANAFRTNTGCELFYTISSKPNNSTTHNVYCPYLPDSDVFIMLSIKKANAPNLFFTAEDGEDEFAWLQNTLEANRYKRCYVFFHEHDNLDKTADPFYVYPYGISESTAQGKAFINLMRQYKNAIWFHGHTHNTFGADRYSVAAATARGYKSVNIPSLQAPREFDENGNITNLISEGYIVDVYDNYIVLNGLDFSSANQDGTGAATTMEVYVLDTTNPTSFKDVQEYHFDEADRVIKNINNFKAAHPNHLIFGAVSDIHVYNGNATYDSNTKESIRNAAFSLERVGTKAGCDFIVNLGDNCWENGIDTDNAMLGAKYSIDVLTPALERLTSFNLVGNHDKSDDTQGQYNLIGVHNDFDVSATTQIRGFGYKDFTDKKVRVIVLNTCDYLNASGGCAMSYEQKDFLIRALDLSSKSDASSWQILLLSHIPLDWNGGDYGFYADLQDILVPYEEGGRVDVYVNPSYALRETPSNYSTYNGGYLVYNYGGKNSAKIIANIHGHVHTNKVSKIANTNIVRVATANTNPSLNKVESYPDYGDYSITSAEAAKIVKVSGTAKDTSATFYCIDLDEQTIYAYGYGADVDRTIIYSNIPMYSVTYNLSNCTVNNSDETVREGYGFNTTIQPVTDATIGSVKVTMGGVDITATALSDGQFISIPVVTGDIVITASAVVPPWSETISNVAVAIRSVWQVNSGVPALANSNTEAALGVTTANAHGYTDRESKTVYLMPVNAKACDVTVTNSDGTNNTYRFIGLKSNGSTFTTVFSSSKISDNTYSWATGSIDYILISLEHTDGTSWAWGYNDAQISVTFTNGVIESGGGSAAPTYINIIDTVGTIDNVRLRSGGATGSAAGFASNYFPVKGGDVIRVSFPNGNRANIPSNGVYCCLYSDMSGTLVAAYDSSSSASVLKNTTTTGYEIHIPASVTCSYARVAGGGAGAYAGWVVTVNEEIN